jgi:regulatory protein YycI of two-component signal transduction system YycFG
MKTTLMNFRAPDRIKDDFQNTCKLSSTNMTSELVKFMMDYVVKENERFGDYEFVSKRLNGK